MDQLILIKETKNISLCIRSCYGFLERKEASYYLNRFCNFGYILTKEFKNKSRLKLLANRTKTSRKKEKFVINDINNK